MIKLLIKLIVLVVVVVVVLNLFGNFLVSKIASDALGVPVKAQKLYLNPISQEAGIYGLKLLNPSGFTEKTMALIPEIFVRFDLSKIFLRKVVIREVRFNLDQVTVVRAQGDKVNLLELNAIKAMREKPAETGPAGPKPTGGETPSKPKKPMITVQVDVMTVSIGRARYVDESKPEPVVREFPMKIQNEVFQDVTDPNRVIQQIVFRILEQVGLNALMPDFDQFSTAFSAQAASKVEEIKEKLSNLFGKAQQ